MAQFEAEDGRERVVDVRGEARGGAPVSGNDGRRSGGSIRPNNGLIGVGAVQRECGAKRGRLWREENGAGWRGTAGAELGGGSARFCPLELDLAPRKENGERNGKLRGVHEDKSADAEVGRDCRRVDELAGGHSGGMGGVRAQ